jgi:hypothetical protein
LRLFIRKKDITYARAFYRSAIALIDEESKRNDFGNFLVEPHCESLAIDMVWPADGLESEPLDAPDDIDSVDFVSEMI